MKKSFRRHPSPAMAVAFVALLAALGGTAVALPGKNKVDGNDIKRNAVNSADIKNGSVTGKDVKNNALTGADVKNDSLGGGDVNEGALGVVPRAATADRATSAGTAGSAGSAGTAGSVGGLTLRKIFFAGDHLDEAEVLNLAGLTLTAACDDTSLQSLIARTTVPGSLLQFTVVDSQNSVISSGQADPFGPASSVDMERGGDDLIRFEYVTPTGNTVSGSVQVEGTTTAPCTVSGTAIGG